MTHLKLGCQNIKSTWHTWNYDATDWNQNAEFEIRTSQIEIRM